MQLAQITLILTPIARGLQTLEGQNTTCSDVWIIFTGIAIGFQNVFLDSSTIYFIASLLRWILTNLNHFCIATAIYEHRTRTLEVYNRRFKILLDDCTHNMYPLAYLLDPSEFFLLQFNNNFLTVQKKYTFEMVPSRSNSPPTSPSQAKLLILF